MSAWARPKLKATPEARPEAAPEVHLSRVRVRFVRDDAPFKRGDLKDCSPAEAAKFQRQGLVELEDAIFGVDS